MTPITETIYYDGTYTKPSVQINIKTEDIEKASYIISELADAIGRKIETNVGTHKYEVATQLGILREELMEALTKAEGNNGTVKTD